MTTKRKKLVVAAILLLALALANAGFIWFSFFRGGYQAELWLGRFDQGVWLENKSDGMHSPRRPMVKAVMRRLAPGMTRQQVEALLGPASYNMRGWQAYHVGYPRWAAFALDHDVFEVRYEQERLVEMRVRST
jgi:hypothetical protein